MSTSPDILVLLCQVSSDLCLSSSLLQLLAQELSLADGRLLLLGYFLGPLGGYLLCGSELSNAGLEFLKFSLLIISSWQ